MFVLVVGGGKVGYYLTKELIEAGHEVVLMEKDRGARATRSPTRSARSSSRRTAARASTSREAGANRADIVAAVTGDDEDNLVICQMAKHHFDVPRTIARVNNPQERGAVPAPRRGRDHQPDADGPRLDRAGHPGPRAAAPRAARRGELELIEAQLERRVAGDRAHARRARRSPRAARCSPSSATASPTPLAPGHGPPGGRQGDRHRPRRSARSCSQQLIGDRRTPGRRRSGRRARLGDRGPTTRSAPGAAKCETGRAASRPRRWARGRPRPLVRSAPGGCAAAYRPARRPTPRGVRCLVSAAASSSGFVSAAHRCCGTGAHGPAASGVRVRGRRRPAARGHARAGGRRRHLTAASRGRRHVDVGSLRSASAANRVSTSGSHATPTPHAIVALSTRTCCIQGRRAWRAVIGSAPRVRRPRRHRQPAGRARGQRRAPRAG